MRTESKRSTRRAVALLALLFGAHALVALGVALYFVPLPERLTVGGSAVVEYRNGVPAHVFLAADERWRIPVTRDDVDPAYVEALVRFEDKRFFEHSGVDPLAIARAVWLNVSVGRRTSGASTLTMQLVRVLEPRPRTYVSKVVEVFRATQLELHLSKDEILAAYMTFAPFGRNIEGVEAASLSYFGHRATELSAAEIATLLAVPQNPNRRFPSAANVERLTAARARIANFLAAEGKLPVGEGEEASTVLEQIAATQVPSSLQPFARDIPHVATWLRARHPERLRLATTIDGGIQRTAERSAAARRESAMKHGIADAAVVVVEQSTGDVVALVGGFDFWAANHGAQIAAFDVPRSTGSLLKPLIFALAVERGLAHPGQLVEDIPIEIGSYVPHNYSGNFDGLVRLDAALSRSLNIPFVRLLNELGVDAMLSALRACGAAHLAADPSYYGLNAAVGGVDLTSLEVAALYAMLAGKGDTLEPRVLLEQPADVAAKISDGARWLTRRALRQRDRPGFDRRRVNPGATPIWWKTGTSYGHRDAWAAGGSEHYTAVVWMGNLNNRSSPALIGADRSAPLLFDVLEGIEYRDGAHSDPRPSDLTEVEVCAYSGHVPTDACTERVQVWSPQGAVPTARCPYHTAVDVDVETKLALVPSCRAGRAYETQSFVVWPARVRRYMQDGGRAGSSMPDLAPHCGTHVGAKPPTIVSPRAGQTLVLRAGIDASEQEVPLEADASIASAELSWFVDGVFVATARADARVWWTPTVGEHELLVMDAAGNVARQAMVVTSP